MVTVSHGLVLTRKTAPFGRHRWGILIPEAGGCMKRKRYSDERIAFALRQAECGTMVDEISRKPDVSEAMFYRRKKQFRGDGCGRDPPAEAA